MCQLLDQARGPAQATTDEMEHQIPDLMLARLIRIHPRIARAGSKQEATGSSQDL